MQLRPRGVGRNGTILPLIALCVVAICGFVALAIDVGMLVVARTQCQNAADAAAMAGARSIDGSPDGNTSTATAKAKAAAEANKVLGQPIADADVTVEHGAYHYDPGAQTFTPQIPPVSPDNYNLTKATVKHMVNYAFARVFALTSLDVSATATATHRPRDVSIVLDYSGSMNNESDLWNNESYLGSVNNSPNNNDSVFPQFGHYSASNANLQNVSSDPRVGKSNVTQTALGVPPLVTHLFQNSRGAGAQAAFTSSGGGISNATPGGDQAPHASHDTGGSWAQTVSDITGSTSRDSTFESVSNTGGYDAYRGSSAFKGYTQGPGYWGKTFFNWPPDPRWSSTDTTLQKDWRKRFFLKNGGSYPTFGGPMDDNTKLWSATNRDSYTPVGKWLEPTDSYGANYIVNYKAILAWIKASPSIFPSQLRAGNILYYSSIPTDVPASAYNYANPNYQITNGDQRFWKEYIDFVLGVWRSPFGDASNVAAAIDPGQRKVCRPGTPACSYGTDFGWGTIKVSAPPTGSNAPYMDYQDNPRRPRHRLWFGGMTMVQYMLDTGLLPGTAQDISMVAAKLGIQGALTDIQNNHPNDLVSMILFSRPHYSGEPAEVGAFSQAQYNLSRDYAGMMNSLWFPPNSSQSDVRPWDPNGAQTPRAHGDYCANTATSYGLMLAYNQFSSNSSLRGQAVGGFGRKGAQRLVILETDGMANQSTQQNFSNLGANNSYYQVLPGDSVQTSSTDPGQDAANVLSRICALTTDNSTGPGFATPRKPVVVHCIAFGAVFEPTAAGSEASNAMALLQQLSSIGGTRFPTSVTATSDPDYYKLCIGTLTDRQGKLRTAFSKIMDDGISVVMVR